MKTAEAKYVEFVVDELVKKAKHTKASLESIARKQFGVEDQNQVKELTELAIVIRARFLANQPGRSVRERFFDIVDLYHSQVNLSHRTSQSMLLQQYSTPAPIGYLAGVFCGLPHFGQEGKFAFEPSAGNGLLTIAIDDPKNCLVNEIDDTRNDNLKQQGFYAVTKLDATIPFNFTRGNGPGNWTAPKAKTEEEVIIDQALQQIAEKQILRLIKGGTPWSTAFGTGGQSRPGMRWEGGPSGIEYYPGGDSNKSKLKISVKRIMARVADWKSVSTDAFDAVITNPPFGKSPRLLQLDNFKFDTLEQVMALNALELMKDSGRAAIIIGGHTKWDAEGRLQVGKNRVFFSYLYKYFNVADVLQIDGHKLYSRQGTAFDTRLILIDGRKANPGGYAPLYDPATDYVVDTFEKLFERVSGSFLTKNDIKVPDSGNKEGRSGNSDLLEHEAEALALELELLSI